MTYGQPSIYGVFEQLEKNPQEHVILLPLFPQYSQHQQHPFMMLLPNGFLNNAIYPV